MNLFKRLNNNTTKEKAEVFKQILKYGDDIGKLYRDSQEKSRKVYKERQIVEDRIKDIIAKELKIKLKSQMLMGDWNMIFINDYKECNKSPIERCVTLLEYGSKNPLKWTPAKCFYCNKEYK